MIHVVIGIEMVRRGMAWYAYQFENELTDVQQLAYVQAENRNFYGCFISLNLSLHS